jgi:hypothetical protein
MWQQPPPPRPPRPQVGDFSKAPAPRKLDTPPSTQVVVMGDAMADWLGHGLEEAYADNPEFGVVRKLRPNTGLIRNEARSDSHDWVTSAREMLAAETPAFIVMILGLSDRVPFRERAAARPAGRQGQPAQSGAQGGDSQAKPDQPAEQAPSAPAEFRSERWAELYGKRVDDMIAALKAKGVPVLWVGLPPIRGPRSRTDLAFLNDLYRARAQKAGITYVDVWDGFVDEDGNFNLRGPDYQGQIRQLRSADGVYFTKAGALKLGHYVEREIQRLMVARATPVALPAPEPQQHTPARPGGPAPRPVAGPVIPLTVVNAPAEDLAGSGPARTGAPDPTATSVLVRGEAAPSTSGRADDFSWPRAGADDGSIIPAAVTPAAAPAVQRPPTKKGPAPAAKQAPKRPGQAATTRQVR